MRLCIHCDSEVIEVSMGDEGWSVCSSCRAVEAGSYDPDEDDDSEDEKPGNNAAGLKIIERAYDRANEARKRDKGE